MVLTNDNQIQVIQYENVDSQGETQAKKQETSALKRNYMDYLAKESKRKLCDHFCKEQWFDKEQGTSSRIPLQNYMQRA